jgi:septal ring factor EnvC (AmiA/AmiB activator)
LPEAGAGPIERARLTFPQKTLEIATLDSAQHISPEASAAQARELRAMLQKAGSALEEARAVAQNEQARAEKLEQALRTAHKGLTELGAELEQERKGRAAAEARLATLEEQLRATTQALRKAERDLAEESRLRLSAEDRSASDRGWVISSIAQKNQAEGDLRMLLRAIEMAPGHRGRALRALHKWLAEQPPPPPETPG